MVRVAQKPQDVLSPLQSVECIGGNQGNLLYQFSACRALASAGNELSYLSYVGFSRGPVEERAERINAEADHLVLPLSSSFRLQMLDGLNGWAELIEHLTIPVTIIGIGAQLMLRDVREGAFVPSRVTGIRLDGEDLARHEGAARRFVAAALDHGPSIGVRGDVTRSYLRHLGFSDDNIDIIGCPSVFMRGPGFRLPDGPVALTGDSSISMSLDNRILATESLYHRTIADYPRCTVYAQEKFAAGMTITGMDVWPPEIDDPAFPPRPDHPMFREHRMVYAPTAWAWLRLMEKEDFAFGPRLHGTVAALLAGVPSHLIVHDSRTLEIAEYHALPHTLIEPTQTDISQSAQDFADATDNTGFNTAYDDRFAAFVAFLERNGLSHAYDGASADALAAFDASLEPAAMVPPIYSGYREAPRGTVGVPATS